MKIPTFRFMGGKARLRKWLLEKFPRKGNIYCEPFCGIGNVFYLAANELHFNDYFLNDKYSTNFLIVVRDFDIDFPFPQEITPEKKEWLLNNRTSTEAILLENVVTFGGKGYSAGFTSDLSARYNPIPYKKRLEAARVLLQKARITNFSWEELGLEKYDSDSFCYFDPPYYGTKASYPNIDHRKLVEILNSLKCKWALSGYDNTLYTEKLNFVNKYQIERNSEIKSSAKGKYTTVTETLLTNY